LFCRHSPLFVVVSGLFVVARLHFTNNNRKYYQQIAHTLEEVALSRSNLRQASGFAAAVFLKSHFPRFPVLRRWLLFLFPT